MTALIDGIDVVAVRGDPASIDAGSVEFDSRQVRERSLFCCIPGARTDGHLHAAEAVGGGATSLLCDHFVDLDVVQVQVPPGSVRPAMARVASTFFGHPSAALTMAGVTGTNGKTTVAQLLKCILDTSGRSTGVIGTLEGARTTPEAPVLQRLLAGFRDDGHRAVAMEVSSHALTQHRVDGIVFDVAAFTNLSREHLDHHRTMDEYFAAKAGLFDPSRSRVAVINVDDPWGGRLAEGLSGRRVVRVQRSDATEVGLSIGSSTFVWRGRNVTLPLSGSFNIDNALLAAGAASALGIEEDDVVAGLGSIPPVPGRMEVVTPGPPFAVMVDYAHTPAGLDMALSAARGLAGSNQVICLFGCGGDRDQGKRPEMGAVAARGAKVMVLTSDNPRSEDPMSIIEQIRSGIPDTVDPVIEPDRAEAIRIAVGLAQPGDVVLLAGKGHETSQVTAEGAVPFDDRTEAARALAERFNGAEPLGSDE